MPELTDCYYCRYSTTAPYDVKPIKVHGTSYAEELQEREPREGFEIAIFPIDITPPDTKRQGVRLIGDVPVIDDLEPVTIVGAALGLDVEVEIPADGDSHVIAEGLPENTLIYRYDEYDQREFLPYPEGGDLEVTAASPGELRIGIQVPPLDGRGLTRVTVTFV